MTTQKITRNLLANHPILNRIGGKPGIYEITIDKSNKVFIVIEQSSGKEWCIPIDVGFVKAVLNGYDPEDPKKKDQVAKFRMPDGQVIEAKISANGNNNDLFIRPLKNNPGNIHFHALDKDDNKRHILIRDSEDQNIAAYILNKDTGDWIERPLTEGEKKPRTRR
jgi:hypothetical protein